MGTSRPRGEVDALVTGPVNNAAMHAAGEEVEGQTELLSRWSGSERYEMMGFAGRLRVMLATRHVSLRAALDRLTTDHVLDRLLFLGAALRSIGLVDSLVAVAGLNPHAGEGGLFGREEIEVLAPAIEQARAEGMKVEGPVAPDSALSGAQGEFGAVLALYHDQALFRCRRGQCRRTFIPGLPTGVSVRCTGQRSIFRQTASDGQPVADPESTKPPRGVEDHAPDSRVSRRPGPPLRARPPLLGIMIQRQKKKIVLYQPKQVDDSLESSRKDMLPLELMTIAAFPLQDGFEVKIGRESLRRDRGT